jgi:uncharacterized protein YjlB
MTEPESFTFPDDGRFPNSVLPLLVYRQALPADASEMEETFARNGWSNSWRDGIFDYHHFHSTAHEVLGVARGTAHVCFGGPSGQVVGVRAGDVVVIPAGVGHCNKGQSHNLLVVGAYPGGADYDIRRGEPGEHGAVLRNILRLPLPEQDPVAGPDGPLVRIWQANAPL